MATSSAITLPQDYFGQFSYPLYCRSSIGDGHSGWYAISSPDKCNDFCFWETTIPSGDDWYDAENTADPHQTTSLLMSNWRCAMDVAEDDDVTWNNVKSKLTPIGFFGPSFQYLRCSNGPAEVVWDGGNKFSNSLVFWSFALVFAVFCFVVEAVVFWRRRKSAQTGITNDETNLDAALDATNSSATPSETEMIDRGSDDEENKNDNKTSEETPLHKDSSHSISNVLNNEETQQENGQVVELHTATSTTTTSNIQLPNCSARKCAGARKICIIVTVVAANVALLGIFLLSIFSLADLSGNNLSDTASNLTPACSDPKDVCHLGNNDIDRPSTPSRPSSDDSNGKHFDAVFSYLVASDAQADWYAGEQSGLGVRNIPIPCDEGDSCGECTAKFGEYTNRQVKKSIEKFTTSESQQPRAKTLIMNGDLTAFFHPHERKTYQNVFHNVKGLEHYFPSLGNHDYAQGSTSGYGADKWFGAGSCNAKHSIGYMRDGFCGKIPNFNPQRIVRYDAASLAYSWEEGGYHFVHLHYYPAWESQWAGVKSSFSWLERDLALAHAQNLASVIFVHSAGHLNHAAEHAILGKNVKAIFAGHLHRCFMKKCQGLFALQESHLNTTNVSSTILPFVDKCIPGTMALCGGNAGSNSHSLFYLNNVTATDWKIPDVKLWSRRSSDDGLCPKGSPTYVNETDNTLLCGKSRPLPSEFPDPRSSDTNTTDNQERIPIFWSGSSSFETFLKVDFFPDRFVINAITAEAGIEGMRYIDTHDVPNAVYPYHTQSDLDEVVIKV